MINDRRMCVCVCVLPRSNRDKRRSIYLWAYFLHVLHSMRIYRELGGHFLCLHARALHAAPEKRPPTCFTTPSRGSDVLSQNRRRQTYVCMLRGRRKNLSLPMAEIPPPLATTTTRALRGKRVAAGGGLPGTYPSKHVCSWWPTTEHNQNSLLRGILEKTKKNTRSLGERRGPSRAFLYRLKTAGASLALHTTSTFPQQAELSPTHPTTRHHNPEPHETCRNKPQAQQTCRQPRSHEKNKTGQKKKNVKEKTQEREGERHTHAHTHTHTQTHTKSPALSTWHFFHDIYRQTPRGVPAQTDWYLSFRRNGTVLIC